MTQEALKLSQEALAGLKDVERQVRELVAENKALKEALAQPERDYERGFIDGMQKQMQSSVDKAVNRMAQTQEPVAWSYWQSCLNDDGTQTAPWVHRLSKFKPTESIINKDVTPLYTTPPKRTWQGLTRDEVLDIEETTKHPLEFYRTIEAKLKEKNCA